mmetsp:Transcript_73220/g.107466  ORF Transcript_73220/g.107466 Transcript_73220/m.107466 type:complete len:246 (+) Transcript_73220:74-811(+)
MLVAEIVLHSDDPAVVASHAISLMFIQGRYVYVHVIGTNHQNRCQQKYCVRTPPPPPTRAYGAKDHRPSSSHLRCGTARHGSLSSSLLCLQGSYEGVDFLVSPELEGLTRPHGSNLDVATAALNHLKQSLHRQLHALFLLLCHVVCVVFLQILPHSLRVLSNSVRLPCVKCARGISLIKVKPVPVIPTDQCGNAKRAHAATLRVLLLDSRHVARDVGNRHRVLHSQAEALALHTCAVDKNAGISS